MIDKEYEREPQIPIGHALEIRRIVHDLSNALEIIVQTQYLLSMGQTDEASKQWLKMMDAGVQQAAVISQELRRYILEHTMPE